MHIGPGRNHFLSDAIFYARLINLTAYLLLLDYLMLNAGFIGGERKTDDPLSL